MKIKIEESYKEDNEPDESKRYEVGHYDDTWYIDTFEPYDGKIVLEN